MHAFRFRSRFPFPRFIPAPAAVLVCVFPVFAGDWESDADVATLAGSACNGQTQDEGGLAPGFFSRPVFGAEPGCDPQEVSEARGEGPEETLLFRSDPEDGGFPESRSATAFTVSRSSAQSTRPVLRTRAASGGWEHRLEVRGDSLTRRRLGWNGRGWRLRAGDLTDATLPPWPRGLPYRALPVGWKPAHDHAAASAVAQGLAAGARMDGWSAYALRVWNPVETGEEPPWRGAWSLHRIAAGATLAPPDFPVRVMLHVSETRITRGTADTLSERLAVAGVSTAQEGLALQAARLETDPASGAARTGGLYALQVRHRFENAAVLEFTARQRDGGWRSAWDPAVTEAKVHADGPDSGSLGAGEARLAGRWSFREGGVAKRRARESGFVRGETWRAWDPAADALRQGLRIAGGWRREEARLELSGMQRAARNASGTTALARSVEAETRLETFPRWELAAWRAWNRDGPTRTGGFLGAEPEWDGGDLRLKPGLRVETDAGDRLEASASLGLRWRFGRGSRGWTLDAAGTAACWPASAAGSADALRWRVSLETTGP